MYMKKGIDISRWQGTVDFAKVKEDRIEFIIARSSYRQSADTMFRTYVRECQLHGIPVFGAYHFMYALNEEEALAEAKFCVSEVEAAGLGKNVHIFCDYEYDTVKKAAQAGVTLGREECNRHTRIFCEYVEAYGYRAGIYTNLDYYRNMYDQELLNKYDIWLADYSGDPDFPCLLQQYTSKGYVSGINGTVDMDYLYEENFKMEMPGRYSRRAVVNLAASWIGKNEADGSYGEIIDTYNSFLGDFPRGIRMQRSWPWCACTWSALAIRLGYTSIMPIEISCGYLIEEARKIGCWMENDGYVPKPGDAVLYDWDDSGKGDNNGWPDHVGTVEYVNIETGYFVVIEGNYSNAVKRRTISINGRFIRGFITPEYNTDDTDVETDRSGKDPETVAREVITGQWGKGIVRKKLLEKHGYDYAQIQGIVNQILNGDADHRSDQPVEIEKEIVCTCKAVCFDEELAGTYRTTGNLYLRNDAGTNKKALCVIPSGTSAENSGEYTEFDGVKWLLIRVKVGDVFYTGFSSGKYLDR